jgi:hypothetical protein
MSFTYDVTQLATTPLYQARLLLRDTGAATHQLEDEELTWLLTQHANVYLAAAAGADLILGRLDGGGAVVTKRVGDLAISYDRSYYEEMRGRWRARGLSHQQPFCGGISRADAAILGRDPDWPPPAFAVGMHDDPRTRGAETSEV